MIAVVRTPYYGVPTNGMDDLRWASLPMEYRIIMHTIVPLLGIVPNVLADTIQRVFVADDVIVKPRLPFESIKPRTANAFGADRFELIDDGPQTTRFP